MKNDEYQGENRREQPRWRLSREVSITDLVTVVLASAAMFGAYNSFDKRIDGLERMQAVQLSTDTRQDNEALRYQSRIASEFATINQKLDRLIEGKFRQDRQ